MNMPITIKVKRSKIHSSFLPTQESSQVLDPRLRGDDALGTLGVNFD